MSTTADVEAVKTEVVELQETKSDLGDLAQLSKEFVSLPFEPVVGGRAANVSFKLFAFGIIGLGIFSLVDAAQTWGIPVAQVAVRFVAPASMVPLPAPLLSCHCSTPSVPSGARGSYESEMNYPDVYLCMPAEYAELFKTTKELYAASGMSSDPSSSVAATIRTACTEDSLNGVGASAFIKLNPTKQSSDDAYFAGSKSSTPPYKDACVYGKPSFSGVEPGRAHFGAAEDDVEAAGDIWDDVDATFVSVSSLLPPALLRQLGATLPPPAPTRALLGRTRSNRTHSFCSSLPAFSLSVPLRAESLAVRFE